MIHIVEDREHAQKRFKCRWLKLMIIVFAIFLVWNGYLNPKPKLKLKHENHDAINSVTIRPWKENLALPLRMTNATPEVTDHSRSYTPLSLTQEWPTIERLSVVFGCTCLGSIFNGLFVASFFLEDTLKRVGFVFLALMGLSDMVITSVVMPTSVLALLSEGEWDTLPVCHCMQFVTEAATYSYIIFFMLVAVENYFHTCSSILEYKWFLSFRVSVVAVFVILVSVLMGALGVYLRLDYDFCEFLDEGNYSYRFYTSIIFYAIPSFITLLLLIATIIQLQRRAKRNTHYKRSYQYELDYTMTHIHFTCFLVFIIFWLPYVILMYFYPSVDKNRFYHTVWSGLCRTIFSNSLYTAMNPTFRHAFVQVFNYCCCKSAISRKKVNHRRRAVAYKAGEVKVHILHHAFNTNSPHHGASSSHEVTEL